MKFCFLVLCCAAATAADVPKSTPKTPEEMVKRLHAIDGEQPTLARLRNYARTLGNYDTYETYLDRSMTILLERFDICKAATQQTNDKKASDLTVIETQLVRLCDRNPTEELNKILDQLKPEISFYTSALLHASRASAILRRNASRCCGAKSDKRAGIASRRSRITPSAAAMPHPPGGFALAPPSRAAASGAKPASARSFTACARPSSVVGRPLGCSLAGIEVIVSCGAWPTLRLWASAP
jgi:hypothetical protein